MARTSWTPDQGCLVLLRIYFKFINDKYISAVSALSLFSLYYWESTSNFTMINISVTSRKDWLKCVRCGLNPSIVFILTSQHFMEPSTPILYPISTNFVSFLCITENFMLISSQRLRLCLWIVSNDKIPPIVMLSCCMSQSSLGS